VELTHGTTAGPPPTSPTAALLTAYYFPRPPPRDTGTWRPALDHHRSRPQRQRRPLAQRLL